MERLSSGDLGNFWMEDATAPVQIALAGVLALSAYVTNVPGPPTPLFLGDARLLSATPISPIFAGAALSFAVLSYDGTLAIAANLDGAIDGANTIEDGLAAELDDLVAPAQRSRGTIPRASRPRVS